MKRIAFMVLAIAFTWTSLSAYGQGSKMRPPKVGKLLVKSLPKGVEGVELVGGGVRLKSGYKFVKQRKGMVAVAAMRGGGGGGGLGISGTWSCTCVGDGATGGCEVITFFDWLVCQKSDTNGCTGDCSLLVVTPSFRKSIIMY
jgi:hypothetical protein